MGCGAVGSLFAANLSLLDDVEVWAYDLAQELFAEHVVPVIQRETGAVAVEA